MRAGFATLSLLFNTKYMQIYIPNLKREVDTLIRFEEYEKKYPYMGKTVYDYLKWFMEYYLPLYIKINIAFGEV